jgi:hypothetical protein
VQRALKVFNYVLNEPKFWDQVCFVVTSTPGKQIPNGSAGWTQTIGGKKCVRDMTIDLMRKLWNWQAPIPKFPIFFVNSEKPNGPSKSEFERFIDFACSQASIRFDMSKMKDYDPDVMAQVPVIREMTREERHAQVACAGSRKVQRSGTRKVTASKRTPRPRPIDAWDVLTLGIAWLARDDKITVWVDEEQDETFSYWVDEPIYKGQMTITTLKVKEQAMIPFSYAADEITTKDLETKIIGRTIGAWKEIERTILATRVEWAD